MFKFILVLFFSSLLSFFAIAGMGGSQSSGKQFNLNLLAGVNQGEGNMDGVGSAARFYATYNVYTLGINTADEVFITDNCRLRKAVVSGSVATVTTIAGQENCGSVNANGLNARFDFLYGVMTDTSGNIYVASNGNQPLRKIDSSNNVTDYSTGAGPTRFGGLARDASGTFYSFSSCAIYKINASGTKTLFSGLQNTCGAVNGTSDTARYQDYFASLYYHNPTNQLLIAEPNNLVIRSVDASGTASTFAGVLGANGSTNGVSTTARFAYPTGITYDASLGAFFIVDSGNNSIRKMTTSGTVSTFTGQNGTNPRRLLDGTSATAILKDPYGIVSNGSGTFYIMDVYFAGGSSLRKIDSTGAVTTIAGVESGIFEPVDGTGSAARLSAIESVSMDSTGNLYILESPPSLKIRKVTPKGVVTTYADLGCWSQNSQMHYHTDNYIYFTCYNDNYIYRMNASGTVTTFSGSGVNGDTDGVSSTAQFNFIASIKQGPDGDIYITDNCAVRKLNASGTVTTVAGSVATCGRTQGASATARFEFLDSIAFDSSNNMYISEYDSGVVRKMTASGTVSQFVGEYDQGGFADGVSTTARITGIRSTVVDDRNNIYISDFGNAAIRKITSGAVVTTPIGRKNENGVYHNTGIKLGPLPTSMNRNVKLLYRNKILYIITPGGVFMAPAN